MEGYFMGIIEYLKVVRETPMWDRIPAISDAELDAMIDILQKNNLICGGLMGSICYINRNPKSWLAYQTEKKLKHEYGGESLYIVRYGTLDDDPGGCSDLEILMRESVYKKVLAGEYSVSKESKYKHRLILVDINGKEIEPISDGFCY